MTSDAIHEPGEPGRFHSRRGRRQHWGEARARAGRRSGGPAARGRPHHHGGARGRHGDRARRGDVRAAVLLALEEKPMHGYQLIQEIGERSGGVWEPSPGAIYPALSLLEDEGLVTITAEGGRKLASLTEAGLGYIAENRESLDDPFTAQGPNPAWGEIRDLIRDLAIAGKVLVRNADDAQLVRVRDLLARTRRDLYRILGDDEDPTAR